MTKLQQCQVACDYQAAPSEDPWLCDVCGHCKSSGIPLDDSGRATCLECAEVYFEHEEKERLRRILEGFQDSGE